MAQKLLDSNTWIHQCDLANREVQAYFQLKILIKTPWSPPIVQLITARAAADMSCMKKPKRYWYRARKGSTLTPTQPRQQMLMTMTTRLPQLPLANSNNRTWHLAWRWIKQKFNNRFQRIHRPRRDQSCQIMKTVANKLAPRQREQTFRPLKNINIPQVNKHNRNWAQLKEICRMAHRSQPKSPKPWP